MVRCKPPLRSLLLAGSLSILERFGFDDGPVAFVVLEPAAGDFGQQLFPDHDRRQPICVPVIGVDRQPGEPGADALVSELTVRIMSTFPLHQIISAFRLCLPGPSRPTSRRSWRSNRTSLRSPLHAR